MRIEGLKREIKDACKLIEDLRGKERLKKGRILDTTFPLFKCLLIQGEKRVLKADQLLHNPIIKFYFYQFKI